MTTPTLHESRCHAGRGAPTLSRRSLSLLARAGAQLAGPLRSDDVAERISAVLLPGMADWFVVLVPDAAGSLQLLTYAHRDPVKQRSLAAAIEAVDGSTWSDHTLLARAATDAKLTWFCNLHTDRDGATLNRLSGLRAVDFQNVGAGSIACVPLGQGSGCVGAVLLVREAAGAYSQEDMDVALELGRRLAAFIANTRAYELACETIARADDVLAVAAHELRTPAASISCYAQLLLRQMEAGKRIGLDDIQLALGRMDQQSRRLSGLVSRLFESAQLHAGKLHIEPRETELRQLLIGVAELSTALRPNRHLRLRAPVTVLAMVDVVQFEQVLFNLLDNAFKFGPPNTEVELSLSVIHGETVRLSVRDHGPGVPAERRDHIFDRYFQAHREVSSGGLGLGLYFIRHIIELHGGRLLAEYPEDGGACFVVELPALRPVLGRVQPVMQHASV